MDCGCDSAPIPILIRRNGEHHETRCPPKQKGRNEVAAFKNKQNERDQLFSSSVLEPDEPQPVEGAGAGLEAGLDQLAVDDGAGVAIGLTADFDALFLAAFFFLAGFLDVFLAVFFGADFLAVFFAVFLEAFLVAFFEDFFTDFFADFFADFFVLAGIIFFAFFAFFFLALAIVVLLLRQR